MKTFFKNESYQYCLRYHWWARLVKSPRHDFTGFIRLFFPSILRLSEGYLLHGEVETRPKWILLRPYYSHLKLVVRSLWICSTYCHDLHWFSMAPDETRFKISSGITFDFWPRLWHANAGCSMARSFIRITWAPNSRPDLSKQFLYNLALRRI